MQKSIGQIIVHGYLFLFLAGCNFLIQTPSPESEAVAPGVEKAQPTSASLAPEAIALPPGVEKVAIGTGFNNQDDCDILAPLPAPIEFPSGTSEFAFQVVIDPERASGLNIAVDGPGMAAGVVGINCDKYAIIMGAPAQYQWGATLSPAGGEAFLPGTYVLTVTAGGRTVEMPFEIE
jgi:hypothetical protein